MEPFKKLLEINERLLSPSGCPWDLEQTFESLRSSLLEEACEIVESIDLGENEKICEELGDLLYLIIFYCKIAEKEGKFSLKEAIESSAEKLIRRHPHIFSNAKAENAEEVAIAWEEIKKREKGHQGRKSALDGIPHNLPALSRAYRFVKKMEKVGYPLNREADDPEEAMGQKLLDLVVEAKGQGIEAEQALRKALAKMEQEFRHWEKEN